ncbi:iron-containing alcohol dehydrogenase [Candidatus Poribacteria bacterium]|nr:iron-containing alcohol dehydrogenase [Candidatus Poribacteria bacterium]
MLRDDCSHEKIGRLPSIVRCPFANIKEHREAVVLTTAPAWKVVNGIDINTRHPIYADSNTRTDMAALAEACKAEVVYGIGGGLAIDTAKYVAAAKGLPLIALPTILSTDAFLTDATGVRENGCVHYVPSKAPDTVIIDMEVLCNAPASMRASGAADVLSIATALWDWQEAEKMEANPSNQQLTPQAVGIASTLLQTLLDNAREIGNGTPTGLKLLLDLLCMEVQLCYQCGHSRVEEGSEHYFVYAIENHLTPAEGRSTDNETTNGESLLHGELVGLGILLMAVLQSQPWTQYRHALECLQINYRPSAVARDAIAETLINLSDYVAHHQLPYTVATTLRITPDIAERTIQTILD